MASLKVKDHGAVVATVAAIFLATAVLSSHASTAVDEPAKYKPTAPAPPPAPSHSKPPHAPPPAASHPKAPPPPPAVVQPVIVVHGVIYCKSCKLRGYNSGMDASPLPNATASLVCYGDEQSKYRVLNQTSTATNGYFIVMVYELDMFDQHSCRLYLRSSPTRLCAAPFIPSNPKLGLTLEKDLAATPPNGARGVFHPAHNATLMYAPATAGKCPPYY